MKKEKSISTQLGLTIEETAMLLGISRGQLAMYEIGKRKLPLSALQILAALENHSMTSDNVEKRTAVAEKQNTITQKFLETSLRENEYQIERNSQMLETLTKKQSSREKLTHLTDLLGNLNSDKKSAAAKVTNFIPAKARKSVEDDDSSLESLKLEHRMEMLQYENKVLRKRLATN